MFLEKLEIQGFKSFANKNLLVFPGMLNKSKRGLTAIVGPNGSGKSNVADAVRWALGEQSMKTLRGKKSEDIIFSGSDKKGKLGMAEVSLFLNNEDGKAPIDYSQIVLTRRLYRNGDSEYILNSNKVRLADIQMLLAKAKFGQKTYSVIGQGMVEGFLNTSLAERKEFFDEATGVKQYQIKRDDALNKLRLSYENLIQAQMLLAEIEPRLRSLTRQVNKLEKREELEKELKESQAVYYRKVWHDIDQKFREHNEQFLELEKQKVGKEKKMAGLQADLDKIEKEGQQNSSYLHLQDELIRLQASRDGMNKVLARLDAQIEFKLEAAGQFDLSFLISKKQELEAEIKNIAEEAGSAAADQKSAEDNLAVFTAQKIQIENQISKLGGAFEKIGSKPENNLETAKVNARLSEVLEKLKRLEKEADVQIIKQAIKEISQELSRIINKDGASSFGEETRKKWLKAQEEINSLGREKEDLLFKINEQNLKSTAVKERQNILAKRRESASLNLRNIEAKLKQHQNGFDMGEIAHEQAAMKKSIIAEEEKINSVRTDLRAMQAEEEKQKNRIFSLQKELQNLQSGINILNSQLSEIKINSTRYETKLEDLEIEIREEGVDFAEIKKGAASGVNIVEVKEKIKYLKKQLDLIGGIDPEVAQEYKGVKEKHEFLTRQVNDLTQAIASLEKIIKELDQTIKDQFDKEFKLITKKFEEYFKILFNGGSAKIIKVMEDALNDDAEKENGAESGNNENKEKAESLEALKRIKFLQKHSATGLAGIEIQAVPPGKKIKSVSMLSGGERALTAIALICAIISANPSPFVVLDEVDAALDEANSERLAKILDELSHKTQFIVITHNRATMRKGAILYGITMQDDGVSKMLSIKLEEAQKSAK